MRAKTSLLSDARVSAGFVGYNIAVLSPSSPSRATQNPRVRLASGLVCFAVCLVGCKKPIELDGVVTSKLDGFPVRGVSIVRLGESELQLGTTASDGCFAFTNVHERSGRSRQIKFSALGYASTTVTIPAGDAKRVRVVLSPDMLGGPSQATVERRQTEQPLPCASAAAR